MGILPNVRCLFILCTCGIFRDIWIQTDLQKVSFIHNLEEDRINIAYLELSTYLISLTFITNIILNQTI